MQNDLLSRALPFTVLFPQSVAAAGTAVGQRIVNPARFGRSISFIVTAKTAGTVTALTAVLQGSNDGGTTWANYIGNDGVTPIQFGGGVTLDAGFLAGTTALVGTLRLDRSKYKDLRINLTTVTGATVVIGVVAVVTDLYSQTGTSADVFQSQQLPLGSN